MRFILPIFLTSVVRKVQKDFEQNMNSQQFKRKPEGEVTIENIKSHQGRKSSKDDGDFVDYEEIK